MDGKLENAQQTNDDINVVLNIKSLLEKVEPLLTPDCCVYRVPHHIRYNGEAFTPKLISIGPLHYDSNSFQNMARYKVNFFHEMLQKGHVSVRDWVNCVEGLEPKVRQSYSENIPLQRHVFIEVISVDAGFILELFWRYYYFDLQENDHFFTWLATVIKPDLLLLENQLPFFFLEQLYEKAFLNGSRGHSLPSFKELTFYYFQNYNIQNLNCFDNHNRNIHNIKHFTDLIRTFYLPPTTNQIELQNNSDVQSKWKRVGPFEAIHAPSASKLTAAGLNLQAAKDNVGLLELRFTSKCKWLCCFPCLNGFKWLLDLPISSKALEIPPLRVDATTQVLFCNLLAYEQCHYRFEPYLMNYIHLLDFLIDTEHDMDILIHNEIIVNCLGETSKAIADLFNSLGRNITHVYFNSDYTQICRKLNDFYKNRWHRLKATLKHDYFNTPWKSIVSFAAITVVIFTAIQAICSLIDVAK